MRYRTRNCTCALGHIKNITKYDIILCPNYNNYNNTHNPLSIHNNMHYTPSTAHSTAFHSQDNPSVHTSNNTRYRRQNGTRCRYESIVGLFLRILPGWFLRVPSLNVLVLNWKFLLRFLIHVLVALTKLGEVVRIQISSNCWYNCFQGNLHIYKLKCSVSTTQCYLASLI